MFYQVDFGISMNRLGWGKRETKGRVRKEAAFIGQTREIKVQLQQWQWVEKGPDYLLYNR